MSNQQPPEADDEVLLRCTPLTAVPGVRLEGEVDISNVDQVARVLDGLVGAGAGEVHVELGELRFIDVAGTRVLVAAAARLAPDRRLVLRSPPAMLLRILEAAWPDAPGIERRD